MVEMIGADAQGRHLRPGLRHLRLPGRGRRISARAPSRRFCATPKLREHFHHGMFHGFDFDNTMLRIGSMNMLLHGVENPDIRYRDSLAQDHAGEEEKYTLVLANPPFAGSLDYENMRQGPAADRQDQEDRTAVPGAVPAAAQARRPRGGHRAGRRAVRLVATRTRTLRQMLVEDQKLDAVISLPGGVFKPYAGVSTAILLFTKTNSGGTDHVWFYDVDADGWCLDDKRTPLLPDEKLGPVPTQPLTADEHAKNNLPDVLARWAQRDGSEREASAHRAELLRAEGRYRRAGLRPLLNRYKEVVHEEVEHRPPKEILAELDEAGGGDSAGMKELEGMLK